MSIITMGIDLAKNIFAVHGVNQDGKAELIKPKLARDQPNACRPCSFAIPWGNLGV